MWRAIGGVVAGYVVMFVVVFATFTVAYLAMGQDGAFAEGAYTPSMMWIVVSFVLGLIAAVLGGLVCALIAAPGSKAPVALVIVVLVLGLLSAIPAFLPPDEGVPTERTGDVSSMEAMMRARTPVWVALVNPLIGAVGVVIGAKIRGGPKAAE